MFCWLFKWKLWNVLSDLKLNLNTDFIQHFILNMQNLDFQQIQGDTELWKKAMQELTPRVGFCRTNVSW